MKGIAGQSQAHNARSLATSLMVALVAPGPRPAVIAAVQGGHGRIEGVATIAKVLTTVHRRIRVYDDPGTPPPAPASDVNPLSNVVIYLESTATLRTETSAPVHPPAVMRQQGEMFVPHVLPILAGTTVEFPNEDPVFHDVFSLSSARTFDLQRYPRGTSRTQLFPKPGVVELFCHIHADMSGYILVLDNPYYVIPDSVGHFALDGVPAGDYHLVAWYERSHPVVTTVHVDAGKTGTVALRIPIPVTAGGT